MARQISLHPVIDAIDKVLAQLDELAEKGTGSATERQAAENALRQTRSQLLGLCESDDKGYVFYMVNS